VFAEQNCTSSVEEAVRAQGSKKKDIQKLLHSNKKSNFSKKRKLISLTIGFRFFIT
jgi:hypothetical protein